MPAILEKLTIGSNYELNWEKITTVQPGALVTLEVSTSQSKKHYLIIGCHDRDEESAVFHMDEERFNFMHSKGLGFVEARKYGGLINKVVTSNINRTGRFLLKSDNEVSWHRLRHEEAFNLNPQFQVHE